MPVNLKRYFSSKTISNFFSYITVSANQEIMLENGILSFDKILSFVKNDFKIKLTQEEIQKTVSTNVRLGTNPFIKSIPLVLKKPIVRLSYSQIRN